MRVFVTGGTGFVGKAVIELLKARGDQITALVRDPERARSLLGSEVNLLAGDLTGPPPAPEALAGHEVLLHAACARKSTFASGSDSAAAFNAVNTEGTRNLARAWRQAGSGLFVHLSSTAAMGAPQRLPVTESDPCHPRTPYGRSKYEAEHALQELAQEGLAVVILRPCLIVGEGKEGGEVTNMLRLIDRGRFPLIIGKELVRKPLVHVSDVAQAILLAARQGEPEGLPGSPHSNMPPVLPAEPGRRPGEPEGLPGSPHSNMPPVLPAEPGRRPGKPGSTYLITSGVEYRLQDVVTTAAGLLGRSGGYISLPELPVAFAAAVLGQINRWTGVPVPLTSERLELFLADRTYSIDRAKTDLGYAPRVTDLTAMLEGSVKAYRATR